MAFNLVFPCQVDISGETTITQIKPDASIVLNDATTTAGLNAYSLTYTDVATELEQAHYSSYEMLIQEVGNQSNQVSLSPNNLIMTTEYAPSIQLTQPNTNQMIVSTNGINQYTNTGESYATTMEMTPSGIRLFDTTTFFPTVEVMPKKYTFP